MGVTSLKRAGTVLAVTALMALAAGCGSDSSGQTETSANAGTETAVSIPSPTSPIPTTTAATTTSSGGGKQKKPAETTTTAGGSAPCSVPEAYQDFKYAGIDCTAAVAVATDWDQNGKDCNTIDNPNSPDGYHRTCSVEGFSCTAKRDIHSDNRFVSCTQGGQSVRFTWLPA
jgi:pyruvate/2-oxoglutarate dehydrogenase complex dihydrolipoamide acyltransferase (E2) component